MDNTKETEACTVSLEALDERNAEQHGHIGVRLDQIELKLDAAMEFQKKLRWVGGTILLTLGGVVGWILSHIVWLWEILPPHTHTH